MRSIRTRLRAGGLFAVALAVPAADASFAEWGDLAVAFCEAKLEVERLRDRVAVLEDRLHTAEVEREQLAPSIISRELSGEER